MFLNRAGVQNNYSSKVRLGNWAEEQELEEVTTHSNNTVRRNSIRRDTERRRAV